MAGSRLVNRNVISGAGRTSMRLEPELWDALREIANRERSDLGTIIRQIESQSPSGGRTSAVRVFIVQYFRAALNDPDSGEGPKQSNDDQSSTRFSRRSRQARASLASHSNRTSAPTEQARSASVAVVESEDSSGHRRLTTGLFAP